MSFEAENEDELFNILGRISGNENTTISRTDSPDGTVKLSRTTPALEEVLTPLPETPAPAPTPDPIVETPEPVAETPAPAPAPVAAEGTPAPVVPTGVEVDKDGLPWDARINPPSKLKLKKEGTWKLKRSLDPAFITQVRDELRAIMAVPTAAPETPAAAETPAPAPVVTETAPAPVVTETAPAPAPEAPESLGPVVVTTFPEFMQEITKRKLDDATVLAAVKSVGLPSPALVAARPDLIPAICAVLFV